jgi:hypothetical protein
VVASLRLFARVATAVVLGTVVVACDSIDPTAQSFGITFHNDTGRSVHLKVCSNNQCTFFDYSDAWKPGQDAQENISDRQLLTRWLVQDDQTGRTVGCLPLEFSQKYEGVLVKVSQSVPCPGATPLRVQKGKGLGRS